MFFLLLKVGKCSKTIIFYIIFSIFYMFFAVPSPTPGQTFDRAAKCMNIKIHSGSRERSNIWFLMLQASHNIFCKKICLSSEPAGNICMVQTVMIIIKYHHDKLSHYMTAAAIADSPSRSKLVACAKISTTSPGEISQWAAISRVFSLPSWPRSLGRVALVPRACQVFRTFPKLQRL